MCHHESLSLTLIVLQYNLQPNSYLLPRRNMDARQLGIQIKLPMHTMALAAEDITR
jgi:hypothetical protein